MNRSRVNNLLNMKYLIVLFFILYHENNYAQNLVPFRSGNKWGFSQSKNPKKIIIKPQYQSVSWFQYASNEIKLSRVNKNGKFGFINIKNEIIIPLIYEEVGSFQDFRARISHNGKYGFINIENDTIIPCIYDKASHFKHETAKVELKGVKFHINNKGEKVIGRSVPCREIQCNKIDFNIISEIYHKNKKVGLISGYRKYDGPILDSLEAKFQYLNQSDSKTFIAKLDNKYGIIDLKYNVIQPFIYDAIYMDKEDELCLLQYITLRKNSRYGFATPQGKQISETKYYKVNSMSLGYTLVWYTKRKWGYIDHSGREYFKRKRFLGVF